MIDFFVEICSIHSFFVILHAFYGNKKIKIKITNKNGSIRKN